MVKLGPDVYDGKSDAYSGYLASGNFSGFSMLHEQGTGGVPKYGTVSQLPLVGVAEDGGKDNITSNPLANLTIGRGAEDDDGSVGYYRAKTTDGVTVELSATARAGIYQYTFPDGDGLRYYVLVDVSHVLPTFRQPSLGQAYKGGSIEVDSSDAHYTGYGVYDNGWNEAPDWTIYFCELSPTENGGDRLFFADCQ